MLEMYWLKLLKYFKKIILNLMKIKEGENRLKINKGEQLIKKDKKDKKGCC